MTRQRRRLRRPLLPRRTASARSRNWEKRRAVTGRRIAAAADRWAGAILAALVPFAAMAAEQRGITVPLWSGDRQVQGIVLLACLLLDVVLCAQVPAIAV